MSLLGLLIGAQMIESHQHSQNKQRNKKQKTKTQPSIGGDFQKLLP